MRLPGKTHVMKRYLIDTNIIIEIFKSNKKAYDFVQKNSDKCFLHFIVVGELLQGARNKNEQEKIDSFVKQFVINWGNPKENKLAIELLNRYNSSHNLKLLDAQIASCAINNKMVLVTQNTKHFKFIPKLTLNNPVT